MAGSCWDFHNKLLSAHEVHLTFKLPSSVHLLIILTFFRFQWSVKTGNFYLCFNLSNDDDLDDLYSPSPRRRNLIFLISIFENFNQTFIDKEVGEKSKKIWIKEGNWNLCRTISCLSLYLCGKQQFLRLHTVLLVGRRVKKRENSIIY